MAKFVKSTWFKCITVLLVISVISGGLLAALNDLLFVASEERTARAVAKIYGEEITVPASAVMGGSISNLEASSNRWTWTNWYDLDLGEVTLADGANEITVTFLDNGFGDTYDNPACGQVDCANIFFGGEVA